VDALAHVVKKDGVVSDSLSESQRSLT